MSDGPGSSGLDIVIVSYRCRELLRHCLTSLRKNPATRSTKIFVIDNASDDGSAEVVRLEFPEVELHVSDQNLGYARANNLAIRKGSGEYVLALNPDTRMTSGALDHMLELMDTHPKVGIAGCRLQLEDGTFDHAAKRSFPTPLSALGHFTGVGRRSSARGRLAAYRAPDVEVGPVDAVNGAFMLIRRHALDEVGPFDEHYWMYMEDLDLCYRFRQAGWQTWYEPGATVIHVKAGSSGRYRRPRLNYAFHFGMYRFYRNHYAQTRHPVVNVTVYAGIACKLVLSVVRSTIARRITSHPA